MHATISPEAASLVDELSALLDSAPTNIARADAKAMIARLSTLIGRPVTWEDVLELQLEYANA